MEKLLYLGMGGFIGTVGRYLVSVSMTGLSRNAFYLGTISVNLIGSLVIGFLASLFLRDAFVHPGFRLFFITGMLGGFTTFSSFSFETLKLIQEQRFSEAFLYVGISIFGGIACAAAGWYLSSFIPR